MRYFVAVAEELNFRKAAERLNVSRPALSKQVKELEEEMRVRLLERDTVSVSLTKAGEVFLEDARRVLDLAERAVIRAVEAGEGSRGRLRIGSVGVIARDFLPGTLKRFREELPGVEVEFVEMLPAEQIAELERGRIDIGFAYGTDVENRPHLESLKVIHSTFGVGLSRTHRLARRKRVSLEDIAEETMLCLGHGKRSVHREEVLKFCCAQQAEFAKVRSVDGFDSLVTLLAADQGVSLLPIVLNLENQGVTILPLAKTSEPFEFEMWAVWRGGGSSGPVARFVGMLEERGR